MKWDSVIGIPQKNVNVLNRIIKLLPLPLWQLRSLTMTQLLTTTTVQLKKILIFQVTTTERPQRVLKLKNIYVLNRFYKR